MIYEDSSQESAGAAIRAKDLICFFSPSLQQQPPLTQIRALISGLRIAIFGEAPRAFYKRAYYFRRVYSSALDCYFPTHIHTHRERESLDSIFGSVDHRVI